MKARPSAAAAFILMVVLLTAAVCLGAYRHWSARRSDVAESLSSLTDVLDARVEVAHNILTVASRHLPLREGGLETQSHSGADIRKDIAILSDPAASLSAKASANVKLSADAGDVLAALAGMASVLSDDRDLMYAKQMLPQALEQSADWAGKAAYNAEAEAYNTELVGSFSGRLARLMGVRTVEQFIPAGEEEGQP